MGNRNYSEAEYAEAKTLFECGFKKCRKCTKVKVLSEFYAHNTALFGLSSKCKGCYKDYAEAHKKEKAAYDKARREANKEFHRNRVKEWFENNPEARRSHHQRRKALKRGATVEAVNTLKVFERDEWICQLCFEPVDKELSYPDQRSKSLDHIIPLSKGGEHSYANTQLAHFECNVAKGNKL